MKLYVKTILLLIFSCQIALGQVLQNPLSTVADTQFSTCWDTLKLMGFKKVIDIDRILPSWHPVLGNDEIIALEGTVIPRPNSLHVGTHVSHEDYPLYHYTHDVGFNIWPDSGYQHLLAMLVYVEEDSPTETPDTIRQGYMHVEWESGLGANNKGNPCSELNKQGKSCGFFSSGHERKDIIWNWPTLGDWAHVEGLYIWDRGHPPAGTEIHPIQFCALKRNLPELITTSDSREVYATRIDIYASGDGGALRNNRKGQPDFVHKAPMSQKDYSFGIKDLLPKPSPNATLSMAVKIQKGDTYTGDFKVITHSLSDSIEQEPYVEIFVPWKGLADTLVFARTVFVWWNEGKGIPADYEITTYKVTLESIRFKNRKEFVSRSELRVFLEVSGNWLFLNEFTKKKNILDKGLGKTWRRGWKVDQEFVLHVPTGKSFRIHGGGWEADGTNKRFGTLFDPYAACTPANKRRLNKLLSVVSPHKLGACHDDRIGEVHVMHSPDELKNGGSFLAKTTGYRQDEICPCNRGFQDDVFRLKYRVELVKD